MSAVGAPESQRLGIVRLANDGGQVTVVDLDGKTRSVSGGDWADRPLAWASDGHIIYVAMENQRDGPHHRVRIVPATGGEATTVWEGRATNHRSTS